MATFSKKAWFSLDQDKLLVLDKPKWQSAASDKRPSIYAPDFFLKDKDVWLTSKNVEEVSIPSDAKLTQLLEPIENWQDSVKKELFISMFKDLKEMLAYKDLKKGVPYSYCSLEEIDFDPYEKVLAGMKTPKKMMHYGYTLKEQGLFGVSPETLFELKDGVVKTMALAGTRDKRTGEFTAKDQVEHQHVVKDISELLANFGEVTTGKTGAKELSRIEHLYTPIECRLDGDISFESLVHILHPTPALGVYPRNQMGRSWLAKYQKLHNRRHFGAPFGIRYPNGDAHCIVAIRNVQYFKDQIEICAGCGVVEDSSFEKEWNELLLKIQSVRFQWGLW